MRACRRRTLCPPNQKALGCALSLKAGGQLLLLLRLRLLLLLLVRDEIIYSFDHGMAHLNMCRHILRSDQNLCVTSLPFEK